VLVITEAEIADVYDVSINTVKKWRTRYKDSFPTPIGFGIRGPRRDSPNWKWADVERWVVANLPHLLVGRSIEFPGK